MIRLFVFSIFLISCGTKVDYKDLSPSKDNISVEKFELLKFNPQIEMMIMFLWPIDLGPEHEKEVIEIISTSRKISKNKEIYLKNLFLLGHLISKIASVPTKPSGLAPACSPKGKNTHS